MKEKPDSLFTKFKKAFLAFLSRLRTGPVIISLIFYLFTILAILAGKKNLTIDDLADILGTIFLVLIMYIIYIILQSSSIVGRDVKNS